jgi:hypothetical protein
MVRKKTINCKINKQKAEEPANDKKTRKPHLSDW